MTKVPHDVVIHRPEALAVLGPDGWRRAEQEDQGHSPLSMDENASERLSAHVALGRTVVFLAPKAYFNQIRMSVALRRLGWTTIVVVLNPDLQPHNIGFFDDVVSMRLHEFLAWWSRSDGVLLHTQGWLFRYHIPVLVEACKPPRARHVVEFMDLNRFMFPLHDLDALRPEMEKVWGHDCEANHRTQIACEGYLVAHADGVVFPGDAGHQAAFARDGIVPRRALNFMCYPLADFFATRTRAPHTGSLERLRLVFAGGIPTSDPRRTPAIFADAQWVSVARALAASGLNVDVFNNPLIADTTRYHELYPEHLAIARQWPNYRFAGGAPPWQLSQRIRDHDAGLMIYDFSGIIIGEEHFEHLVPTKLFMYLEAGLPVIVSDRWRAVVDLVEAWGIGISVADGAWRDLPRVLRDVDFERLRLQGIDARHELAMDRQIHRLVELYDATGDA